MNDRLIMIQQLFITYEHFDKWSKLLVDKFHKILMNLTMLIQTFNT